MLDNIELFTMALNIEEPFRIEKIDFNDKKELHIYIGYSRGSKFKCKECGKECNLHDTKEKVWRHLNFFEHKSFIHCKLPRIKCEKHGVHTVDVSWANSNTGFTLLFEELVVKLARKMSILAISKILQESNGRLWRIVKKYADKYMESLDFTNVRRIGLDETSQKGHKYITVFMDLDTSKIIYIAEGKKESTIEEFAKVFVEHKGKLENIEAITCDMYMGFSSGMKKIFKNAKIIYDKFHVIKLVNEAVDDVRRSEVKEEYELKKGKYCLLKNEKNLTKKQKVKLKKLCQMNLKTVKAYRLKLAIQDIYNMHYTPKMAKIEIEEWISWVLRAKIEPMKAIARTIASKLTGILNYFEFRITNAVLEGTNSMIQSLKSNARGYKKFENFKSMIYLMNSSYGII